MVRAARRGAPRARVHGRGRRARRGGGPGDDLQEAGHVPGRMHRPRLPHRLRAPGVPAVPHRVRHPAAGRPGGRVPAGRGHLHPVREGRGGRARREHHLRRRRGHRGRGHRRPAARAHAGDLHQGRGDRPRPRHHPRRHQGGIRLRRRHRRHHARRRGAHPGLLTVLGRRHLRAGQGPALLRQAVRPRLADLGRVRLGQVLGRGAAGAAGRRRRPHPQPLRRGLRESSPAGRSPSARRAAGRRRARTAARARPPRFRWTRRPARGAGRAGFPARRPSPAGPGPRRRLR